MYNWCMCFSHCVLGKTFIMIQCQCVKKPVLFVLMPLLCMSRRMTGTSLPNHRYVKHFFFLMISRSCFGLNTHLVFCFSGVTCNDQTRKHKVSSNEGPKALPENNQRFLHKAKDIFKKCGYVVFLLLCDWSCESVFSYVHLKLSIVVQNYKIPMNSSS